MTCWHWFPALSAKWRFHGKLITVITFEPRIFSSTPTLLLFPASSAFCWYLTLAFKAFVVLARAVTDTQTHTHTMITRTSPRMGEVNYLKFVKRGQCCQHGRLQNSGIARILKLPGHSDCTLPKAVYRGVYSAEYFARSAGKKFSPSFFTYQDGLSWHFCASHCKQSCSLVRLADLRCLVPSQELWWVRDYLAS